MNELDKVIDFAKEQSRAIVESGDEHVPVMIAISPDSVNIIALVNIDKDAFVSNVSRLLRELRAHAYVFINEAWGTRLLSNSPTLRRVLNGEITVSQLPPDDKEEILTVTAVENGRSFTCWSANVKYTRDGSRYLGEWDKMGGIPTGRLILKEW